MKIILFCQCFFICFYLIAPSFSQNLEKEGYFLTLERVTKPGRERKVGEYELLHLVWYHPVKKELVYQPYKKNGKKWSLTKEKRYDLKSKKAFKKAKKKMLFYHLYSEEKFNTFKEIVKLNGNKVKTSSPPKVQNENDKKSEEYLANIMPNKLLPLEKGSVLTVVRLGKKEHYLVIKINTKREIIDIESDNGLKVRRVNDKMGRSFYRVLTTGPTKKTIMIIEGRLGWYGQMVFYIKRAHDKNNTEKYEKSLYELAPLRNGIVNYSGERKRLNGHATDEYLINIKRGGLGLVETFVFEFVFTAYDILNFLNPLTKRKQVRKDFIKSKIKKTVKSSISKDDELGELVSKEEINEGVDKVIEIVEDRTKNFTKNVNFIRVVTLEESLSLFTEMVLLKILGQLLPNEKSEVIKEISNNVLKEFRKELKESTKKVDVDAPLKAAEKFETEAPIKVGREILRQQLLANGIKDFEKIGVKTYNNCIIENYLPFLKVERKDIERNDIIQACLMKTIMLQVRYSLTSVIKTEVGLFNNSSTGGSSAEKITLSDEFLKSVGVMNDKCMEKHNYFSDILSMMVYNFNKLKSTSIDDFLLDFNGCVDVVKKNVGRMISKNILLQTLDGDEDIGKLKDADKNKFLEDILEKSYDTCATVQESVISREARKSKKIPEFNPKLCRPFIVNAASNEISQYMIKKELGEDAVKKILSAGGKNKLASEACFVNEHKDLKSELESAMMLKVKLNDDNEWERINNLNERNANAEIAGCLNMSILWAVENGSGEIVKKILNEDEELKSIKFGREESKFVNAYLHSCFKDKLPKLKSPEEISAHFSSIKDSCGAKMLKERRTQEILFLPTIKKSLAVAELEKSFENIVAEEILAKINLKIKNINTIDGILKKIKEFEGEAVLLSIDLIMRKRIMDSISDKDPVSLEMKTNKIFNDAKNDLFMEKKFGEKILNSMNDSKKLSKVIGEFQYYATLVIAPKIVNLKGNELLESGIFENEGDVKELTSYSMRLLENCLAGLKKKGKIEEESEQCLALTITESTYFVMEGQIEKNIGDTDRGKLLTDAERKGLREALLGKNLKKIITRIGRIKDRDVSERAFQEFILKFTLKATSLITHKILPHVLKDFELPEDKNKKILSTSLKELNSCFIEVKDRIDDAKHSDEIHNDDLGTSINNCSNKMSLSITKKILPFKLKEIYGKLDSNENQASVIADSAKRMLNDCVSYLEFQQSTSSFDSGVDSCLSAAVLNSVEKMIISFRKMAEDLLELDDKTIKDWRSCLALKKKDVLKGLDDNIKITENELNDNNIYFKFIANMDEELRPQVDFDWSLKVVESCMFSSLIPGIIVEYRNNIVSSGEFDINNDQKIVFGRLSDAIIKILKLKNKNGENISFKFLEGKKEDSEKKPGEEGSLVDSIRELGPELIDVIKRAVDYNNKFTFHEIARLESRIEKSIRDNDGILVLKDVNKILVDSPFMDLILKIIIAKKVSDYLSIPIDLTSKNNIKRIFNSKSGKLFLMKIKKEWLIKAMNGELENNEFDVEKYFKTVAGESIRKTILGF